MADSSTNPTNNPRSFNVWTRLAATRWLAVAAIAAVALTTVLAAVFIGYQVGVRRQLAALADAGDSNQVWTCSMHPQLKLPKFGKCPVCFMDLIPLDSMSGGDGPRQLVLSKEAVALADIRTAAVESRQVERTIRMVGKVGYDERRVAEITAWTAGRLDRLYVDYTGIKVRKGDHMVYLYSPDLIIAQQELIQAVDTMERYGRGNEQLLKETVKASEEKLRLLGLLPEQIADIKKRKKPTDHVTIYAPASGTVVKKHATEGAYVQKGSSIYSIADLRQVWVKLDAYESDVPWLRYGQTVEFASESYPGEIFKGRVAFIDPVLNERTRTVQVRVNVSNEDRKLKPGMFVRAQVKSPIAHGGLAVDPTLVGKWISPMHPEIVKDGPGKCDICGMDLVPAEQLGFVSPNVDRPAPLVIPVSAPLITGKRAIVYVKLPNTEKPTFEGREVLLGARAGDLYIVRHGLEAGEQVVVSGSFRIDADLQIQGRLSMMNQEVGAVTGGHQHGGSDGAKPGGDPHAGHKGDGETTMSGMMELPPTFRVTITPVYAAYLQVSDALAADDLAAARRGLDQMVAALKQVDYATLDPANRSHWKSMSDPIVFAAYEARDSRDRPQTRAAFRELSQATLALIQHFGHAHDQPVNQFNCPMAFDNAGAVWLQTGTAMRNPYAMECGEVAATFHPAPPLVITQEFRTELDRVYAAYFRLQQAMSKPGDGPVSLAAEFRRRVATIRPFGLDARAAAAWKVAAGKLTKPVTEDWSKLALVARRRRFEDLSSAVLGVIIHFGHQHTQPLFKAYCPMAFDNQGAYWLQTDKQITNPYFSGKMLKCGNIKQAYPAVAGKVSP